MPAARKLVSASILAGLVVVPLVLAACRVEVGPPEDDKKSSSSSSGGSSSGTNPAPTSTPAPTATPTTPPSTNAPPEVLAMFGTQVTATPDKIRGTFSDKQISNGGAINVDIRFRFEKDRIIGGAHCIIDGKDVTVGGITQVAPFDVEAKQGTFVVTQPLVFQDEDVQTCTGRLDAAAWDFTVTALALEVKPQGKEGFLKMQKVGD